MNRRDFLATSAKAATILAVTGTVAGASDDFDLSDLHFDYGCKDVDLDGDCWDMRPYAECRVAWDRRWEVIHRLQMLPWVVEVELAGEEIDETSCPPRCGIARIRAYTQTLRFRPTFQGASLGISL